MISNFREISRDGKKLSSEWRKDNIGENFNVIPIVGASWIFNDKEVEKKYPYNNLLTIMPDMSGIIAIERVNVEEYAPNTLVFYEPDGSERFRINPPIVSERSRPRKAFFYYVRFLSDGGCECIFDDGHHEYVSMLNVSSGDLGGFKKTRV